MKVAHAIGVLLRSTGPRRLSSARTLLAGVVGVVALAQLTLGVTQPLGLRTTDLATVVLLLVLAAGLLRLPDAPAASLCVLAHLIGIAVLVAMDLISHDATVVGQVFFYLPVLCASTTLKLPGAILVTALAVAGEAAVVLTLLPTHQALTELGFVGTTLITTAVALGRAGVLQDRLVAQLRRQATIDPLTGLLTRRVLDEAAAVAVAAAVVPHADTTSLLLIDVDRLKLINDEYGHAAGDQALTRIADVVSSKSRRGDVVARIGGDEIAVLLPGCGYEHAIRKAQELVESIGAVTNALKDGTEISLSISIGVASVPEHALTAHDLYIRADTALYVAKRGGRGRVGLVPVAQVSSA